MTMDMPYKPGNISDRFKTGNLVRLVEHAVAPLRYVELHGGEGRYGGHLGTALAVLRYAQRNGLETKAFLHEIRDGARKALRQNTEGFPVDVARDWRETLDRHIGRADGKTLFCIDPCTAKEYDEPYARGRCLVDAIGEMCEQESGVFAYLPTTRQDRPLLERIHKAIIDNRQAGLDLWHKAGSRTDHNIVVACNTVLDAVGEGHFETARRLGVEAGCQRI